VTRGRFLAVAGSLFAGAAGLYWLDASQSVPIPPPVFDHAEVTIPLVQPAIKRASIQPIALPADNPVTHLNTRVSIPDMQLLREPSQAPALLRSQEESSDAIWQRIKNKMGSGAYQQVPLDNVDLAKRLQESPQDAIYQDIDWLLRDDFTAVESKGVLLDLLAETATPNALVILLGLAQLGSESAIYFFTLNAIERLSENRWNGKFHEELSPTLESVWTDPATEDPALVKTIGNAIAEIGAAKGAETLVKTLSPEKQSSSSSVKQETAFSSIPKISNPAAVNVLGEALTSEPTGSPAFEASGSALANIGNADAVEKIIVKAQTAPPETARNFEEWLGAIDDPKALSSLSTAANVPMQSPEVSAAFSTAATNKADNSPSLISKKAE
jgi:hypothetical protein